MIWRNACIGLLLGEMIPITPTWSCHDDICRIGSSVAMGSKMKRQLIAFARDLDTLCGRMNAGLSAVAILLGFLVMTVSVIRAQEFAPEVLGTTPTDYTLTLGE